MNLFPMQQQVLYQADANVVRMTQSIKARMNEIGTKYVNQLVRVQTVDGRVYEGVILGIQDGLVYLKIKGQHMDRQSDLILTLVLYELLVITLLYT